MTVIHVQYHDTPIGEMIIGSYDGQLCLLDYHHRKMRHTVDHRLKRLLNADFAESSDPLISRAIAQLEEYLAGQRKTFDLPLLPMGTVFQRQVWQALMAIDYGSTASYQQVADAIGQPKAVRAVANANGANALSIVVPCHRIIGSNGTLTGYGGGLTAKEHLLTLEGALS